MVPESPYAGRGTDVAGETAKNVDYARACLHDCITRGEAPIASHLLYTQPGVLNDDDPAERKLGIEAGLEWGKLGEASVVYVDRGISKGMKFGIARARKEGRLVEYRSLHGLSVDDLKRIQEEAEKDPGY
ncbi:MAG: hypothetical protein Q8L24_02755 [bacterium]|nr:hypothetical protein [bacterium]